MLVMSPRGTASPGPCTATVAGRRLLLVVPSATSFETFLTEVAANWTALGGHAAVAAGPALAGAGDKAWPPGVERFGLPSFRGRGLAALARVASALRSIVQEWQPDIVHAHFAAAITAAAIARLSLPTSRAHWLATFHGLHSARGGNPRLPSMVSVSEKFSARLMSQNWVLNHEDQACLANTVGTAAVRCHQSFGVGCDLEAFDPRRFSETDRRLTRESLDISPDAAVLLYVGRKVDFKGFSTAVRAFWAIRDRGHDAHLVVIGNADPLHASGLSMAETDRYGNDRRISDVGWQQDVARYLAIADLAVVPSIREGMPVALMESLAMGVPVVTSNHRGCVHVVRGGLDGLTLPAVDCQSVAAAICELLEDRERLGRMAREASRGRGRFSREHYTAEQISVYAALPLALPLLTDDSARRRPSSR